MGCFFATLILLIVSLYEVRSTSSTRCSDLSNTKCSQCVKVDHCYWCPPDGSSYSGRCSHWDWGDYPNCKGNRYYYGQCNLNGVSIIIFMSLGVFLLLVVLVCCFVCCCYYFVKYQRRRRGRRNYTIITETQGSDVPVNDMYERQRLFQAERKDEVRHKYGLDTATNDSIV